MRQNAPWNDVTRVLIVTDSTYVTENVIRAPTWKRNGWRNRYNQPIANDDLWHDLLAARGKAGIHVGFVWQPGKKSVIAKRVDKAAKAAAERGGIDEDTGYRPGGVSRSMVKGVAQPYPARGQVDVIRPYVKKIMLKGENRISFNTFDERTQTYVAKFFAFAMPTLATELHMNHGYRVRFNGDPRYPQILERIEEVPLPRRDRKKKTI